MLREMATQLKDILETNSSLEHERESDQNQNGEDTSNFPHHNTVNETKVYLETLIKRLSNGCEELCDQALSFINDQVNNNNNYVILVLKFGLK